MQKYAEEEVSRAASRIWTEGRANPTDWEIRTRLGRFTTSDRSTWQMETSDWTAELRQSTHGQYQFLALFEGGVYRGRYHAAGWHAATDRTRVRQLRSYQLPLVA